VTGRVIQTARAVEDLVEIFTDAARRGPRALARRRAAFERTLALLADNPGLGARRLPAMPDVQVFPCDRRYLVFYRPLAAGDGIDVPRVSARHRATGRPRSISASIDPPRTANAAPGVADRGRGG
jgi:plasmid stabilization system protein ParE